MYTEKNFLVSSFSDCSLLFWLTSCAMKTRLIKAYKIPTPTSTYSVQGAKKCLVNESTPWSIYHEKNSTQKTLQSEKGVLETA